jgi:ABC-type antimicrobial peptide transport system permease subunit
VQLASGGIILGGIGSLLTARLIASLLFGIEPSDPVTFLGIAVVMLLVAFLAGYVPSRRASRVDPMVALRAE